MQCSLAWLVIPTIPKVIFWFYVFLGICIRSGLHDIWAMMEFLIIGCIIVMLVGGCHFLDFFYDYFWNDIIMGCCRLDPAWQNLRCVWFVLKLRSLMFTWQAMIHSMLFTWPLSCACFMVLIIKFAGLIRWVSFKKIWVFVVSVALLSLNTIFEVPIGPTCGSSIVACSLLFWS